MNNKAALASMWTDKMTVSEYQEIDKPNGSTGFQEVYVIADAPCKLSFTTLANVEGGEGNAPLRQVVKVFCDAELDIKAGSKIEIVRDGKVYTYRQSGTPGRFSAHQEIVLIPFDGWA